MKLKELKETYKNKFTVRVAAGILCVALAGTSAGACLCQGGDTVSANAAKSTKEAGKSSKNEKAPEDAGDGSSMKEELADWLVPLLGSNEGSKETLDGKEETVYLIADANGKVQKTIVSNWLKNGSGSKEIKDFSILSDIENVKGDEAFTQKGGQMIWQADGKDIFYRGTTAKELPITQKVTYYLDGQEIMPNELAGKSGKVTIRFDYENHAAVAAEVNGKKETVFVPFTVISGMVFDDNFRNVCVNNGRILSDGKKAAAVGFAMPGLRESLDVDEEDFDEGYEFPDYVEITADVEDFELEMTATVAVAGFMPGSDIPGRLDFGELDKAMDDMSDAMSNLKKGGGRLADGLDTLNESMGSFSDGVKSLEDGVNAYTDGAARLADGIRALSGSSGTLEEGVNALHSSAKTICDGVQKLDAALNTQMSEEEKAAAIKEASETIGAQFQKGTDTYQKIYGAAVQNFNKTMTDEGTVQAVQAGIQAGLKSQGLTSQGVVMALAQYYAENGFTDASGKEYTPQICQSAMPGTETTYAAYFASAVLNGGLSSSLAGGITQGIAEKGAPEVGESAVSACASAAVQAGGAAAISGAESAKKKAAAAMEAKDGKSGHSLVSGMEALSAGTQKLAGSMPALKNGIGQLVNGAEQLSGNNAALKDGAAKLADGTVKIRDGVVNLGNGAHKLSDGLAEFDEKAISKMAKAYHGDVKELAGRLEEAARAGEGYHTFSGALEGVDATTKFIFRTEAVKAEEK